MTGARPFRMFAVAMVTALAVATAWAGAEATVGKDARHYRAQRVFQMQKTSRPLHTLSGRVVMLVFFSTFSERCVEAVPDLNEFHDKLGPHGLTIVAVTEEEPHRVEEWIEKNKPKFALTSAETESYYEMQRFYAYPGMPWGYLIGRRGKVEWQGHPQSLSVRSLKPRLRSANKPPQLPPALAKAQPLLDEGRWGAARTMLLEMSGADGLDKVDKGWAKGTAEWVEHRSVQVFKDAEETIKLGEHWDAWADYDAFPARFEGLDGAEKAAELAAKVRADPAAADDLAAGDGVAKAADLIARKKTKQAALVISRILKKYGKTRHAKRAKELRGKLK